MKFETAVAFITAGVIVSFLYNFSDLQSKEDAIDQRVTTAERTLVMLHTCFPRGHYKADAASECPAFKQIVDNQLKEVKK